MVKVKSRVPLLFCLVAPLIFAHLKPYLLFFAKNSFKNLEFSNYFLIFAPHNGIAYHFLKLFQPSLLCIPSVFP